MVLTLALTLILTSTLTSTLIFTLTMNFALDLIMIDKVYRLIGDGVRPAIIAENLVC